jgi:hypothetical protein
MVVSIASSISSRLQELGKRFGITRERVRQLEKNSLGRLRRALGREPQAGFLLRQLKAFAPVGAQQLEDVLVSIAREEVAPSALRLIARVAAYGAFVVAGLPDLWGVYYTADGFTRTYGTDGIAMELGGCPVAETGQVFYTDTTIAEGQVWVSVQEGDNRLVGALRIDETGVTHNYLPDSDRGYVIEAATSHVPGENPWAGWAVFESTFYNSTDFFPNTDVTFNGDPAFAARFTLICG